jgi:hypothetical protein
MPDRSKNKEVQVILREIHKGGGNYVASVSKSFKTAESGFAFAKRAQDLCNALGRRDCSDEVIHDSITEMRAIAQKAHDDAKATTKMFDANKQEFTEVRRGHIGTSRSNTASVDPTSHFRDFQSYRH